LAVEILYKSSFLCSETNTPSENRDQQPIYSDETISNMVDALLRNSDLNNDGFIDYAEFKQAENK
jgi:Ca2+-binding EF-hand superfamily protein